MFTHLHTHSDYSFLDALPKVSELAKKAAQMGMSHVALTDRANMHGAIEFYKYCKSEGVKPVLGCEMFVAPRSRFDKQAGIDSKRTRILLIAKNNTGYENLLKLVTTAYSDGFYYIPRIDTDCLEEFSKDIIAILPRGGGEITPFLETGDLEKSTEILKKFQKIFAPEDLFLETTPRPNAENERVFQKNFRTFCEQTKINPVVTNDVKYLEPEDQQTHDTLVCMQYTMQKSDADRISFTDSDLSFWSEEQIREYEYFQDIPEGIDNTQRIADQCSYEFTFGVNLIPQWDVPKNFKSDADLLRVMCEDGIRKRFGGTPKLPNLYDAEFKQKLEHISEKNFDPITQEETTLEEQEFTEVTERLYFELETIDEMGFNAYFLIVGDFVQWAKDNGVAVGPGRGSAAGAIVAYLLDITDLNPLDYGLFFERFLNPERVSMPDIDIDFADTGREKVLEYTRDKYGRDKVANVCTFGTMAARSSVKDVGRVYGVPFSEMNEFIKLISDRPGTKLMEAYDESEELRDFLAEEENKEKNTIFETAKKLEGNIRHVSVHACAVMITPEPILKYCPLQPAPKDPNTLITQFQAKPLEMLGLLKMDFLGLRNLSILENTIVNIHKTHGRLGTKPTIELDMNKIPMDDPAAYKLLTDGFTTGVFQLESPGMTRYLVELKPSQFEDLIAMVSLYRPGPMKFIPDYIGGKHGTKRVKYPHPSLENILKETFGIAVYQEQILEIAKIFGGFTLGGADILRRAIGKKIQSELDAQREKFIQGAVDQGHSEKLAIEIFDEVIVPFAGYGFNKSHAACYAMISYQTAYLKAHYPVEFLTALLTSDAENTDRVILDIEEARKMKIEVLPPSVLESDFSFGVIDDKTIRFGLNAIKGIGATVVEAIITAREEGDGFENFVDFLEKCGPRTINKKSLEALAKAGALKDLETTENILANVEKILQFTKDNKSQVQEGQDDLFGAFDIEIEVAKLDLGDEPEYSLAEMLRLEKEVLGIYVSDHPLRGMKEYFEKTATPIKKIPQKIRFSPKKIAKTQGLLCSLRKLITKKGDAMAIGQIEDISGKVDIVIFPKSYAKLADSLILDSFVKIEGKADKREGQWQIMVDKCESYELEEIRDEALAKGLLNLEETSFVDTEVLEENVLEEAGDTIEVEGVETGEDTQVKTEVWDIHIPENAVPPQINALKEILKTNPGQTEVLIHFKGKIIPTSAPVLKNSDVEKKVEGIF